jgi:hypothetical protein
MGCGTEVRQNILVGVWGRGVCSTHDKEEG